MTMHGNDLVPESRVEAALGILLCLAAGAAHAIARWYRGARHLLQDVAAWARNIGRLGGRIG